MRIIKIPLALVAFAAVTAAMFTVAAHLTPACAIPAMPGIVGVIQRMTC